MPRREDIIRFDDDTPPVGASPWVVSPTVQEIEVVSPNPMWPELFERVAALLRDVLGPRALEVLHVGSTSVPGLPAKPIIDVDLIVADPAREDGWLPALVSAGLVLTVREPWWYEHRMLRCAAPLANVHVFGPDSPEPWKHRIFRDHLRDDRGDRELYASVKKEAATCSNEQGGGTMMAYNRRKQEIIREIYGRAFANAGLLS